MIRVIRLELRPSRLTERRLSSPLPFDSQGTRSLVVLQPSQRAKIRSTSWPQSGERIKVFVSNLSCAVLTSDEIADNEDGGKIMELGDLISRDRQPNAVEESVMVYSLQYNSQTEFLLKPVTYAAAPGVICNCWCLFSCHILGYKAPNKT